MKIDVNRVVGRWTSLRDFAKTRALKPYTPNASVLAQCIEGNLKTLSKKAQFITLMTRNLCRLVLFLRTVLCLTHLGLSARLWCNTKKTLTAPMATMPRSPSFIPPVCFCDCVFVAGLEGVALNCRLPRRTPGLHSGLGRSSNRDALSVSVLRAYCDNSVIILSLMKSDISWSSVKWSSGTCSSPSSETSAWIPIKYQSSSPVFLFPWFGHRIPKVMDN